MISRDPLDLVTHAIGPNHQYPDGLVLFLGTMFAPTKDRFGPGQGFTHAVGDIVTIATPKLGALVNRVDHSDKIRPWTFGAGALMRNLARRGLSDALAPTRTEFHDARRPPQFHRRRMGRRRLRQGRHAIRRTSRT